MQELKKFINLLFFFDDFSNGAICKMSTKTMQSKSTMFSGCTADSNIQGGHEMRAKVINGKNKGKTGTVVSMLWGANRAIVKLASGKGIAVKPSDIKVLEE